MSPGDLGRWLFWVGMRPLASPRRLGAMHRAASVGARVQGLGGPDALLHDELQRCFPALREEEHDRVARGSQGLHLQCLAEELLLDRLDATSVQELMRFEEREHLDDALALGRGVVLVYPHAGAVMLLIALLSLSGYDYSQLALRGFPPEERRQGVAGFRPTRLNTAVRRSRDAAEDALPAHFIPVETGVRDLVRALDRGGIVGMALDGRGGSRFRPTRWLGRTALLSTGPWRLAGRHGAPVVPGLCVRQPDRSHRLVLGPAVVPDMGLERHPRCEALQREILDWLGPRLAAHPDHYARWLLHCRRRSHVDDHPLFADQAADEGWRVHEDTGF